MNFLGLKYARNLGFGMCFCLLFLMGCSTSRFVDERDAQHSNENPDIQRRASIRLQLAVEYYEQGKLKLALDEIRQVLLISPNLSNAYNLRALIQTDMDDTQHAEENFLHAMKIDPLNSEIMNNYARFLCQIGREKQALPMFDRILTDRTYATPVKAMMNAGVCSLKLKEFAKAERYFMAGFQVQPNNPLLNANLAQVYFDLGQFEKAHFYIQRVLKEEIFAADVLWLAIKIETRLGDREAVTSLSTQLRRRYPNSKEYALFQKGAFNE